MRLAVYPSVVTVDRHRRETACGIHCFGRTRRNVKLLLLLLLQLLLLQCLLGKNNERAVGRSAVSMMEW